MIGTWQIEQLLNQKGDVIVDASKIDSLIAHNIIDERNYFEMKNLKFTAEDSMYFLKKTENVLQILFETQYKFSKGSTYKYLHGMKKKIYHSPCKKEHISLMKKNQTLK